jgi:hypothetical protein
MFSAPTDIDLYRFNTPCVQYIWKYDISGAEPTWQAHVVDSRLYYSGDAVSTIRKGEGFWLKAAADCELEINDVSFAPTDPNAPSLSNSTFPNIEEETLSVMELNSSKENTSYRIVGGDDHRFFSVTGEGKLSFTKALYSSMQEDVNEDNIYNVIIEANASGSTSKNTFNIKMIPSSEYKIVSNFFSEVSTMGEVTYTPTVLGGAIESLEGSVTYKSQKIGYYGANMSNPMCAEGHEAFFVPSEEVANYSEPTGYQDANGDPMLKEDFQVAFWDNSIGEWGGEAMADGIEAVCKPKVTCSSGAPTCGGMTTVRCNLNNDSSFESPGCVETDENGQLVWDENWNTIPIEGATSSCISGWVAVCDDGMENKTESLTVTDGAISLPHATEYAHSVEIIVQDGNKQASQTFTYTPNGMFTAPSPQDITVSVAENEWTKIDFKTALSFDKTYFYEANASTNGYVVNKKDGSVWYNGGAGTFKYRIDYGSKTEQKTVTVEVQ